MSFRRVAQATRLEFGPAKVRLFSQQPAHRFGHFAGAEELRAGDVNDERRRGHLLQGKQRHGVVVALPDDVEMAHRQVDGIAGENFARQVHQHAVAQLAGIKSRMSATGMAHAPLKYSNMRSRPRQLMAYSPTGCGESVSREPPPLKAVSP